GHDDPARPPPRAHADLVHEAGGKRKRGGLDVSYDKERYASDPDYRAKIKASNKAWAAANRPKINAGVRRRLTDNPKLVEAHRSAQLLYKYGITREQYNLMVQRQNGLCMLCRRRPLEGLCVDHCHVLAMLRSLLCRKCNTGLGNFGDN